MVRGDTSHRNTAWLRNKQSVKLLFVKKRVAYDSLCGQHVFKINNLNKYLSADFTASEYHSCGSQRERKGTERWLHVCTCITARTDPT